MVSHLCRDICQPPAPVYQQRSVPEKCRLRRSSLEYTPNIFSNDPYPRGFSAPCSLVKLSVFLHKPALWIFLPKGVAIHVCFTGQIRAEVMRFFGFLTEPAIMYSGRLWMIMWRIKILSDSMIQETNGEPELFPGGTKTVIVNWKLASLNLISLFPPFWLRYDIFCAKVYTVQYKTKSPPKVCPWAISRTRHYQTR